MVDIEETKGGFIDTVISALSTAMQEGFASVWAGFLAVQGPAVNNIFKQLTDIAVIDRVDEWESLFTTYKNAGLLDDAQISRLMSFRKTAAPFDRVLYIIMAITLFINYFTITVGSAQSFMTQKINQAERPGLPDVNAVIQAAFVAPEKTAEIWDILEKWGFTEEAIKLLFLSRYKLYDEMTIRDAWLRKILTDDEMVMRMRELGYTDTRIKEITQTWPLLPGPSDLFWMVGKEAFEPEIYEKIGLDAEFPTEQLEWLKQQGISEEWARKYWIAHWEQPSIQQGYEMVHRGVIPFDDLDILYKAVEIPPFWRDKLSAIAYQPYTRVDVRRMHDLGVIDDEQLIKAYMDLGYDEEHAVNMAKFTVLYNAQGDKELTRSQVLAGYREKAISKEDAFTLLRQLEYTEDQVTYFLLFEDYLEQKDYQDQIIKNIRDRYINNLVDEIEVTRRLGELNLPSQQVAILIDKWAIDKYEDRKIPSKADLAKFLTKKVISKDEYRIEMRRLGYGANYVEWYEQLALQGVTP